MLQDGDRFLPESNAICFYLANGSKLIPDGHFDQADMLRWMFWEQYNHEPNIATMRFWLRFVGLDALADAQRMQISRKREAGLAALDLMDKHLEARKWFVADQFSLADICLFAYTHVADEAEFRPRSLSGISPLDGADHDHGRACRTGRLQLRLP